MDVILTDDDVRMLRGLLHDYLPELKFEATRTDTAELRHILIKRQTLCERLLDQLSGAATRETGQCRVTVGATDLEPVTSGPEPDAHGLGSATLGCHAIR